jgi:hypothetical protein
MITLFEKTLRGPWSTAGNDTQYRVEVIDDIVYLFFQGSSQDRDWKYNFDFPATPYKNQPVPWKAHRGFVNAWKAAEDQVMMDVAKVKGKRKLIIAGYSHGGALAVLAHEDLFYHHADPTTYTFGAPRVLWLPKRSILSRFEKLTNIANRGDIVTHVPPCLIGYCHAGKAKRIGCNRMISHFPHYKEAYKESLNA